MTRRRLRPHRDDVLLAVVSVLAGLLLWSLGVLQQPDGRDLLPAWAALVPLVALGSMELLRRTAPERDPGRRHRRR